MNIKTELYQHSVERLPKTGQVILAHQTENLIVVYQAYNDRIADFAIQNQFLGGPDFSYNRMSWIKPNFLWMMYRCGWAEKENQQRVLAFWIDKTAFEAILNQAAFSSFDGRYYETHEQWKNDLDTKEVRLQWDPDHDPYGHKFERRAIQLGMKGKMLKAFGKQYVKQVDDVTDFVRQQKLTLDTGNINNLLVPVETVYETVDLQLRKTVGIE